MDSDSLQLRDLVPAEPLIQAPGWPWWAWAAVVLGAVALAGLVLVRLGKRHEEKVPDPALVEEQAYRDAIEKIEKAGTRSAIQEVATICSSALRRYLATVTGDPSLYETHEQFLARHEALKAYPDEMREHVSISFGRLARMKYGRTVLGNVTDITGEGRDLLQQLHQHRPA